MSEEPDPFASLAAQGLSDPSSLTDEEIQSLCGHVLGQVDEAPPPPNYSPAAIAVLQARRIDLQRKADKRRNEAGYAAVVAELDAWVAEIDAELA